MSKAWTGRFKRGWKNLGEMAIIISSILLAFALQTWWDDHKEHRDELEQLGAIRGELVANIEALKEVHQSVIEHGNNIDQFIELLKTAKSEPVSVSNELLGSAITWRTSDVSASTLKAMESSGGLRMISDQELLTRLAGFPAFLLNITEDEEIIRDFAEYHMGPALARQGLGEVAYRHRLGFREELQGGETMVMPNPELLGLLTSRRVHFDYAERGLPEVAYYMSDLVNRIDQYIQEH